MSTSKWPLNMLGNILLLLVVGAALATGLVLSKDNRSGGYRAPEPIDGWYDAATMPAPPLVPVIGSWVESGQLKSAPLVRASGSYYEYMSAVSGGLGNLVFMGGSLIPGMLWWTYPPNTAGSRRVTWR